MVKSLDSSSRGPGNYGLENYGLKHHVFHYLFFLATQDEVLRELAAAMHSGSGADGDTLKKADDILADSVVEEYHRPISPITAQLLDDFEVNE